MTNKPELAQLEKRLQESKHTEFGELLRNYLEAKLDEAKTALIDAEGNVVLQTQGRARFIREMQRMLARTKITNGE